MKITEHYKLPANIHPASYEIIIVDSSTISSQIIYYHPHILDFDQEQALKGIVDPVISIFWTVNVIDSDREHCYAHFKKRKSNYDENRARYMYLNVCVCDEF